MVFRVNIKSAQNLIFGKSSKTTYVALHETEMMCSDNQITMA